MRTILLVVTAAVLAGCLTGCGSGGGIIAIDRDTEIEIGRRSAAQLEAQYGVVNDPAATARVSAIGRRLAAVSEEPSLPWTFKILNNNEVNAVTLPGGIIYVYKGMMSFAQSDNQLAGVVGHEITHAAHHHARDQIEKAMTAQLVIELVTRRSSASLQQASGIALELALRGGYREDEYVADRYGTTYASKAGLDPRGLRDVLKRMYDQQGDTPRYAWLLQSHPPLSKRIARLDNEVLPSLTGHRGR